MANQRTWSSAPGLAKARLASVAAAWLLAACGGGGGDGGSGGGGGGDAGGGAGCLQSTPGRTHVLACSTNGLPPGGISGGLGNLVGLGFQGTAPADGATGVAVNVIVRVTFNKTMVVAPSITVSDPAGGVVMGSVAIDGANILFTPSSPLASAVTYAVVVDGGQSVDGDLACGFAGIGGPCHLTFSFTTS